MGKCSIASLMAKGRWDLMGRIEYYSKMDDCKLYSGNKIRQRGKRGVPTTQGRAVILPLLQKLSNRYHSKKSIRDKVKIDNATKDVLNYQSDTGPGH